MRSRRSTILLAAATAVFGLALTCTPLPPPGPCGGYGNKHDGWGASPYLSYYRTNAWAGASANIVVRNALLCTTDGSINNFSSAWSMINAGNGAGWAQTGFDRSPPYGEVHFAQQSPNAQTWSTVFGAQVSDGEVHHYWQQYDGGCGCIHSNVDVTRFMDSSFNPKTSWAWPYLAEFSGETTYAESNMPGWSATPTTFSGIQVQDYNNDNLWSKPPLWSYWTFNGNPNRWAQNDPRETIGGDNFSIWNK